MSETRKLKKINITIFNKYCNQDEFINKLNESFNVEKVIVGQTEKTESEELHFHCYVEFSRQIDFTTFKKAFPTVHVENVFGSVKQNYDYCCKNGVYSINFDIENYLQKQEKKESIENALIFDIFENKLSLYLICLKYPKYALYNIKNIKELIQVREDFKNNDKTKF